MININNAVTNILGTPGIITGLQADEPSPDLVQIGTIYIQSDTGTIQQSNGTSWDTIGGGSTPNINNVLAQGGVLTADRHIDLADQNFTFTNNGSTTAEQYGFNISPQNANLSFGNNDNKISIDTGASQIVTVLGGVTSGLNLINDSVNLGDFNNNINHTTLTVDYGNDLISTFINQTETGFKVEKALQTFGYHEINKEFGMQVTYETVSSAFNIYIGDINNNNNGTKLIIDDTSQEIALNSSLGKLVLDGSFTTTTAGGNSGKHLKITINGQNYKIALNNP
jgi:hypothetical protein